jgi:hypothetical protein
VLVPLTAVALAWDSQWLVHYAHNLSIYDAGGVLALSRRLLGPRGSVVPILLSSIAAIYLMRGRPGQKINLDRASLALSITVLFAPLTGLYCAIFALPALCRLSRNLPSITWLVTFVSWGIVVLLSPILFSSQPGVAVNLLVLIDVLIVAATVPVLGSARPRQRPEVASA